MKKYLVQNNRIVGNADGMVGDPPLGFDVYESPEDNIIGYVLDADGKAIPEVIIANETQPLAIAPLSFWGTDLFKKARIRANKDPLLAMQLSIAMAAEQRGDLVILVGAIKSIEDIFRKAAK